MTPDELLAKVAEVIREREASGLAHPGWDRLARGEIDEHAARRQMMRTSADEQLSALFRPLGEDFTGRMSDRVLRHLTAASGTEDDQPRPAEAGATVLEGPGRAEGPGRLPLAPRAGRKRDQVPWRRRVAGASAALAALAAAVLVALYMTPEGPLPAYEASFLGGDRIWRSTERAEIRSAPKLSTGSKLEWSLSPVHPVRGEVVARAFLLTGTRAKSWEVPIEVSDQGAVRVRGIIRELGLSAGSWTLAIAIGRPDEMPSEPSEILQLRSQESPVRLFTQPIIVLDEE